MLYFRQRKIRTRKGKSGRKKEKYEQKTKNGKVKKKESGKGKKRKIDLKHFNFRTVQQTHLCGISWPEALDSNPNQFY